CSFLPAEILDVRKNRSQPTARRTIVQNQKEHDGFVNRAYRPQRMAEKNYITPSGYKRLVDELTQLAMVERPKVVREVSDAAAEGDRSENAAYIYGKKRLREIDRRMGFLQRRLKDVQIVEAAAEQKGKVFFGATVEVEDEDTGESLT